jgi:Protein of unknown function (DUF2800)
VITASALARLRACPSSAVLPRAENHNEWAALGHDAHEELAVFNDDHPFAHLLPRDARAEIKLGYDVATRQGRIIGEGGGRDYGNPGPFEIVGSCDVLGSDGGAVVVIDWKTGFADVEPASSNAQLWFYALAACRALGKSEATIHVVYTQTRRVDSHTIDALDLAEFAQSLERLHKQVAERVATKQRSGVLDTREGSWCKHCPAKSHCPSKNALIAQLASGGLAVIGDSAMTPARAAGAYEQLVKIEQLVKDARKRLEVYVEENGPIDLGNGRMFGRYVRSGNERLSGNTTVQAIAEVVGESADEFASVAIERSTSKAAIERAAKSLGCPKGTASKIIKRVRELGGATRGGDSMPLGEYVRGDGESAQMPAVDVAQLNAALESA